MTFRKIGALKSLKKYTCLKKFRTIKAKNRGKLIFKRKKNILAYFRKNIFSMNKQAKRWKQMNRKN
jgi:hypothetical protein